MNQRAIQIIEENVASVLGNIENELQKPTQLLKHRKEFKQELLKKLERQKNRMRSPNKESISELVQEDCEARLKIIMIDPAMTMEGMKFDLNAVSDILDAIKESDKKD